eukprot:g18385.t1
MPTAAGMKLPAQKALPSEKEFSAPSGQEDLAFDLDITLAVDDKTRHYLYFGVQRSAEEKERSGHATDFGGATVTRKARMHNGRGNADLTLDESSFELVKCPTQLSTEDFYNLDADGGKNLEKYKSEVEKVVKAKTGCDEVVFMPGSHQVRNAAKQTGLTATKVAGYASGGPHTDSSALSGDENFNLAPTKNPAAGAGTPYSGSPANYVEKFAALTTMQGWPEQGLAWVKSTLQTHGANRDAGIAAITEFLVDDALGYQGTKHFAPKEKAAIVAVLLADEGAYMAAARKHFLALVADDAS